MLKDKQIAGLGKGESSFRWHFRTLAQNPYKFNLNSSESQFDKYRQYEMKGETEKIWPVIDKKWH